MDDWHFISLTRRTTKIEETEKQKQRQRDSKTKRWRKPFLSASICCCRAERGRCVWVCVCLYVCDRESVMVRINSDGPFDAWLVPVFLFLLLMLQSFDPPPHSSLSLCTCRPVYRPSWLLCHRYHLDDLVFTVSCRGVACEYITGSYFVCRVGSITGACLARKPPNRNCNCFPPSTIIYIFPGNHTLFRESFTPHMTHYLRLTPQWKQNWLNLIYLDAWRSWGYGRWCEIKIRPEEHKWDHERVRTSGLHLLLSVFFFLQYYLSILFCICHFLHVHFDIFPLVCDPAAGCRST